MANNYADKWLRVCGDLATAAKHFELTRRNPITSSATSRQGYGMGRYGKGGYGAGEESIKPMVLVTEGPGWFIKGQKVSSYHCPTLEYGLRWLATQMLIFPDPL